MKIRNTNKIRNNCIIKCFCTKETYLCRKLIDYNNYLKNIILHCLLNIFYEVIR